MNIVKPPGHISNIVGITVLKKDILLLSVEATIRLKEQGYQVIKGKIYEYNIITQQVDIKVPKIDDPSKVCVAHCGKNTKYLVICDKPSRDGHIVNIYNSDWNLVRSISDLSGSEFRYPVVTPSGNLLLIQYESLSDIQRVVQYNLDGHFVKEVLGNTTPGLLRGIIYTQPYLWKFDDETLQLFLVDDTLPSELPKLPSSVPKVKHSSFINKYKPVFIRMMKYFGLFMLLRIIICFLE